MLAVFFSILDLSFVTPNQDLVVDWQGPAPKTRGGRLDELDAGRPALGARARHRAHRANRGLAWGICPFLSSRLSGVDPRELDQVNRLGVTVNLPGQVIRHARQRRQLVEPAPLLG